MNKVKVSRFVEQFGPDLMSGPAKMSYLLTMGLCKKGFVNAVYTYRASKLDHVNGVRLREFRPKLNLLGYKFMLRPLYEAIREQSEVVHIHSYRNFLSDVGALYSRVEGIPLVLTSHGSIADFKLKIWSKSSRVPNYLYDLLTLKFGLRAASTIVAASKQESEEIVSFGISKNKVRIIPHGVDLPPIDLSDKPKNLENAIRLLVVSRLTYKNNIEFAIRGFAGAYERNHNLRFIIVGDEKPSRYVREEVGYKKKLLKLCKELGVGDKIKFTGWLTGEKLWEAYKSADIFLWTSRYDNFGHALVEAAHFGLPIISTPVGVAPEIIDGGEGGILVQQGDVEGLVQVISTLARDVTVRRKMGQRNQFKAREYSVERMVNRYVALYQELIS